MQDGGILLAGRAWVMPGDLTWGTARSGGPGGQHVNTTESKVELRVRLYALHGLDEGARARLAVLAGRRLTDAGELVLTCESERSQSANRSLVLERLRALVAAALVRPKPRRPTRATRGSHERRLQSKSRHSRTKQRRSGED